MQIHDVVEVTQVVGAGNANTKLQEGWKLLAVVPATLTNNNASSVLYVFGKSRPEAVNPELQKFIDAGAFGAPKKD